MGRKKTFAIVTMGCARNQVDSERLRAYFKTKGSQPSSLEQAQTVILNTCAFTQEAKRESLAALRELVQRKKRGDIRAVYVRGCLSQRYLSELRHSFPEIDDMSGVLSAEMETAPRLAESAHMTSAYLKISEGCINACSYCAIPQIKGPLRSRTMDSLVEEAQSLESEGCRELILIGQDITAYGLDLRMLPGKGIESLLRRLLKETTIPWLRLLYLHPDRVTESLLDVMSASRRVCPYLDVPLQHVNQRILSLMNRKSKKAQIDDLIESIRRHLPNGWLRTSLIVGFPTETEREFQQLLSFVKRTRFDSLGAFVYSREEGTSAYRMRPQVPRRVMRERYNRLMSVQQGISAEKLSERVGSVLPVLVEDKAVDSGHFIGRCQGQAPDVDGVVYLHQPARESKTHGVNRVVAQKSASGQIRKSICVRGSDVAVGSIVKARICDSLEYDLVGEIIP